MVERNTKGFGHIRTVILGSNTLLPGVLVSMAVSVETISRDSPAAAPPPWPVTSPSRSETAVLTCSPRSATTSFPSKSCLDPATPPPSSPTPTPLSRSQRTSYLRASARSTATWSSQLEPSAHARMACRSRVCAPAVARNATDPMHPTNPQTSYTSGGYTVPCDRNTSLFRSRVSPSNKSRNGTYRFHIVSTSTRNTFLPSCV
mmetsp:Transcript_15191/g.65049  ORF Transcript_15191/g.65049 Transcript_15191/m.65049 type:complete len:203 (+) Transcript_15191:379-987(+)